MTDVLKIDSEWMQLALEQAAIAASKGEVPVGAVIVSQNKIIGSGFNAPITLNDPTAHAEVQALRDACQNTQNYRLPDDAVMYVTDVLLGEVPIETAITKAEVGYKVLGANRDLAGVELAIAEQEGREFILRDALQEIEQAYDYIIVDCAPSLSLITVNALAAVDGVMIPMQCEYYALEGLADLTQTIDRIQQALNPELKIIGVLRTMYDARNALTRDVSEELEQYFGKKLYDTVIPRNVRLAEAPAHGLPVIYFEKSSKGAVAYLHLAAEMIKKSKVKKGSNA
jgi:chromosome partitioning protein